MRHLAVTSAPHQRFCTDPHLQGKIVKDKRYAVYSPLDGQVGAQLAQRGTAWRGMLQRDAATSVVHAAGDVPAGNPDNGQSGLLRSLLPPAQRGGSLPEGALPCC